MRIRKLFLVYANENISHKHEKFGRRAHHKSLCLNCCWKRTLIASHIAPHTALMSFFSASRRLIWKRFFFLHCWTLLNITVAGIAPKFSFYWQLQMESSCQLWNFFASWMSIHYYKFTTILAEVSTLHQ